MSGGRVELGIGAGWFEAEHTAYGLPFPALGERFDRLAEQVAIIDGLWRTPIDERYDFAGTYYRLVDSPALPKPVQSPRPPIILGGAGKRRSAALAERYADEYNVGFRSVEDTGAVFERVRSVVTRDLVYSAAQVLCVGRDDAELTRRAAAIGLDPGELISNGLAGTPGQVVDKIGRFAGIGATRLYLQTLDLSDLGHLELVASAVAPQL
jgi:alkanesulfonate monooxygenase SsuD/methylene tetrahydromethanopterin reductase-like flavin-dependent oxidoreductase (luciferase family)